MNRRGRIISIALIIAVHSFYIVYYFFKNRIVESMDLATIPLLTLLGYFLGFQYDKANYLAAKDPLTNVYNRRFITQKYNEKKNKTRRNKRIFFVIVIDCDNFKDINDRLGHVAGDQVLKSVAKRLMQGVRKSDIVARWGGDEFLVMGDFQNNEDLQITIENLQQSMNEISKEIDHPFSVSLGSAVFPDDNIDLESLLRTADNRMYKHKSQKAKLRTV